jgi:hypothetical protein
MAFPVMSEGITRKSWVNDPKRCITNNRSDPALAILFECRDVIGGIRFLPNFSRTHDEVSRSFQMALYPQSSLMPAVMPSGYSDVTQVLPADQFTVIGCWSEDFTNRPE